MKTLVAESLLDELKELEEHRKYIEKRINEIKDLCRDCGSFATERYVVLVSTVKQTRLAGSDKLIKFFGVEALKSADLIKHVEFQVVKVEQRTSIRLGGEHGL